MALSLSLSLSLSVCVHRDASARREMFQKDFMTTAWKDTVPKDGSPTTYYDPADGKPLFKAPVGRSWDDFLKESIAHGWPSFRDAEVIWENVRTLKDGETVSLAGSHLGHNLPDGSGNRYCINLVSCAGNPAE